MHPVAGATVEVVRDPSQPPCRSQTRADGTFSLSCEAVGRHAVRATFGDLRPQEVADVELGPGFEVHLNFMLLPAEATAPASSAASAPAEAPGFWSRVVPNPLLAVWGTRPITLRLAAIGTAIVSFVLGALTMISLGRIFWVETRRLSPGEVGDMVLNPPMPATGERVTPIAVAGARGASANVSYGADEIAAALASRRYGAVFVALVIAPGLFALFSAALAVAMLVGHEVWLFAAMLFVPAGFVLTPIVIGVQALARSRRAG